MAYTIIRTNGASLTTIQDGTINTTSTSLGLPGRNYAGYGQTLNQNLIKLVEHFANDTPPPNPLKGQLWYNTNNNTLNVCPYDGTTSAASWLTLASTNSGGTATLGNLTVTGNQSANNLSVTHDIVGDRITVRLATVSDTLDASIASITSATIPTLNTQTINAGSTTTVAQLYGIWEVYGNASGNAFTMKSGNISYPAGPSGLNTGPGVKCDNYMYANGAPFNPSGTYTNTNVSDFLTGANSVTRFTGNIAPTKITTSTIAGGGNIAGVWTLDTGARFQATYADLAERFEADAEYDPGTVVELGGNKEITAVTDDLSDKVFGVVSDTAAYLMNNQNGYTDKTHPPVAISGRVKVKVMGQVKKGDRLVSAGNGMARSAQVNEATAFNTIGRSLKDKNTDSAGTVEAIVVII